ncbi:MAG: MurT ligase domain-containing protein [Firmicutes bacterium]|nr:MurT ligase domain-containing protein [Bacillota bacterium]
MRVWLAVLIGRLAGWVSRLAGFGGSALPGLVANRLAPGILGTLTAGLAEGAALVTGTNGKTSTSGMAAAMLGQQGWRLVRNRAGANLISGLTTAVVEQVGWARRPDAALFETDEATVPRAAALVHPRVLLVTNFFRDQLDRYGELATTISLVERGLAALRPGGTAVLNADDPAVAGLGTDLPEGVLPLYYGLELPAAGSGEGYDTADARLCPRCGTPLEYRTRYYAHLGDYRCPGCGWERPPLMVAAVAADLAAGLLRLRVRGEVLAVPFRLPGVYNVYNATAAAALAVAWGLPATAVAAGLERFRPAFGRMEPLPLTKGTAWVALVKNPAGFNQVLAAVASDPAPAKAVLVAINDRYADGRDVSWLWDVDFEHWVPRLGADVRWWVSGRRARDMAVRLKYAGVERAQVTVTEDAGRALAAALAAAGSGRALYILPTYTALLELHRRLRQQGLVRHFREG